MTREEMLKILGDLPFDLIWPGSWEDVGFTEREIWVNSSGYGYILCDELTGRWEGNGLAEATWKEIKRKIEDKTLVYDDIRGTVLEEILNDGIYLEEDDFNDGADLIKALSGLLHLKNGPCEYIYALQTDDGPKYFDSESEFKSAFERDGADYFWEDMTDDLLATWISRLVEEDDKYLKNWIKKYNLK